VRTYQPDGFPSYLLWVLASSCHRSILSKVGASSLPGEVQVQGFAWLIISPGNQRELEEFEDELESVIDKTTVQKAYLALFNSSLFELLLAEYCPHVAGGQYDLSPRFVNHIPMPDLSTRGIESPALGSHVRELAAEGAKIHRHGLESIRQTDIDYLIAEVYGVPLEFWPEIDE
jgi:hypothetical protein